ncbi:hypothetical protein [Burkholderia cenocepacia]|uniref:hypothetical protein n=1 Tax=Burkholderia cenocepacia TaxID=95486 RepID=UPI00076160E9|nr:hypothetical protein [Burkholderia cenocepacia]KWU23349.1 hypothetical protein AS149_37390 [Burkholderia cenocepacia]
MRRTDFIDNLELLAHGDSEPFPATLNELAALLARGDHQAMIELSLELSGPGSDRARDAFDHLMDILCVEPVQIRGLAPQGWRAYAGLIVQAQPAGVVLSHVKSPESIAKEFARCAQLDESDVRVLPFLIPTEVVFHQSPIDTFNFCKRVRANAELVNSPGVRPPELEQLLSMPLGKPLVNLWAADDDRPTFAESVLVVLVRGALEQSPEEFAMIERLDTENLAFEAEYEMTGQGNDPLILTHQLVSFGSAWKVFRSSLHMAKAFALGSLVREVAQQHQLPFGHVAVTLAQVEEADGESSIRIAIHHDKHTLLAGALQFGLSEPEQFVIAARTMLNTIGVSRVYANHELFSGPQVDRPGERRVLVDGVGWYVAPDMYQSFD